MKEFLIKAARTKTFGHSLITFSGTFLNGLIGIFFYIILARALGPREFGIFSVSVLFLTLLADVANVGINTGIVRFVGKYFRSKREKALDYLNLGFKVKMALTLVVMIAAWVLIPYVSTQVFGKTELSVPLRISLIGFAGTMMFSLVTSSFDSMQKYFTSNSLGVGTNFLRIVLLALLIKANLLSLNNSLILYGMIPLIGFLLGFLLLPFFLNVSGGKGIKADFFNYTKWIALFTAISALSSRLDTFISAKFLSLEEVGIYSVAVSLSAIVPQVVLALGVVVAPKLASFDSDLKALKYIKKLQLFVAALCGLGIAVGIPLAYFVIPFFYGKVYFPSFYPFIPLLIAQAIFLFSLPVHSAVMYYFGFPKLFILTSLVHMAIISVFGWFLIRRFGLMGASLTVLAGNLSNFFIPAIWTVNKFKKNQK